MYGLVLQESTPYRVGAGGAGGGEERREEKEEKRKRGERTERGRERGVGE